MKVIVDFDLCESNGICVAFASDVFELGRDDVLQILEPDPDETRRADVLRAVGACPRQAIRVEE